MSIDSGSARVFHSCRQPLLVLLLTVLGISSTQAVGADLEIGIKNDGDINLYVARCESRGPLRDYSLTGWFEVSPGKKITFDDNGSLNPNYFAFAIKDKNGRFGTFGVGFDGGDRFLSKGEVRFSVPGSGKFERSPPMWEVDPVPANHTKVLFPVKIDVPWSQRDTDLAYDLALKPLKTSEIDVYLDKKPEAEQPKPPLFGGLGLGGVPEKAQPAPIARPVEPAPAPQVGSICGVLPENRWQLDENQNNPLILYPKKVTALQAETENKELLNIWYKYKASCDEAKDVLASIKAGMEIETLEKFKASGDMDIGELLLHIQANAPLLKTVNLKHVGLKTIKIARDHTFVLNDIPPGEYAVYVPDAYYRNIENLVPVTVRPVEPGKAILITFKLLKSTEGGKPANPALPGTK